MDRTNLVSTPKSFFVKERNQFYSDWKSAFWREFFQNSIDAGAKRIDVAVDEAAPRGSFGRPTGLVDPLVRVNFSDDGCGMTAKVLDDVYFSIGGTTKTDEGSVGGFGRARLMSCFSQSRYSIQTLDRYVEGDGSEYVNVSRDEALTSVARWAQASLGRLRQEREGDAEGMAAVDAYAIAAEKALGAGDYSDLAPARDALAGTSPSPLTGEALRLHDEAFRVALSPASLSGCRIEVDLDATREQYGYPTKQNMLQTLRNYLEQSDVKCAVTINGVPYEREQYKLEGRRDLVATVPDHEVPDAWRSQSSKVKAVRRPDGNWDVTFGRLMTAPTESVPDSCVGKVTVRVAGATMFDQHAGGVRAAVFVELLPALARQILTSNRDGMKPAYKRAMDDLTALLSTDSQAALKKDQAPVFSMLRGGKGTKTGRKKDVSPPAVDYAARIDMGDLAGRAQRQIGERIKKADTFITFRGYEWEVLLKDEHENLDRDAIMGFLNDLSQRPSIEGTFLTDFSHRSQAESMLLTLKSQGPKAALQFAAGHLLGFISDNVALAKLVAEDARAKANADKLVDFHDVPILRDGLSPPDGKFSAEEAKARRSKIVAGARRYDPLNWDVETGKGMQPRKVLAAWTVAVDHCVEALFEKYPDTKAFNYSCGWLFSHPQWTYDSGKRKEGWRDTRAMARIEKTSEDETPVFAFLLNPLDAERDFKSAFVPSNPDDRDRILTSAAHEVAHVVSKSHNDAYAYAFTDIVEVLTSRRRRTIHAEMERASKVVDRVYAEGKTRVAALDNEPGPRPSASIMPDLADDYAARVDDEFEPEVTEEESSAFSP